MSEFEENKLSEFGLDAQDRVLIAAWMLPRDGPLTDEQRRQAMDNFARYVRRVGMNFAQVGRELGSPRQSKIVELVKGVYRIESDEQIRKLNDWVEQHARKASLNLSEKFVTTKVALNMLGLAKLTYQNATMGMALGPTGIGKTRCAQAIAEQYPGSVYVRVVLTNRTPRGLTNALAEKLGLGYRSPKRMSYAAKFDRVIETLRESGRLILIDEAHELRDGALKALRDIHDCAGVPILLIATRDLYDRIQQDRDADHGQLYSRFDVIAHLSEGQDVFSGGKALFTVRDIRDLYEVPPIRLSPDAAKYLQDVANMLGHGSLRRCKALVRNALRRARKRLGLGEGETVTVAAADLEFVESVMLQESSELETAKDRRARASAMTISA